MRIQACLESFSLESFLLKSFQLEKLFARKLFSWYLFVTQAKRSLLSCYSVELKASMIASGRNNVLIAKGAKSLGSINTWLQSHCVKVCVWSYARLNLFVRYGLTLSFSNTLVCLVSLIMTCTLKSNSNSC